MTETRYIVDCDRFGEKFFSTEMKGGANIRLIENSAEPSSLVRRLKERVTAIDGRVGPVGDIVEFANGVGCRFRGFA